MLRSALVLSLLALLTASCSKGQQAPTTPTAATPEVQPAEAPAVAEAPPAEPPPPAPDLTAVAIMNAKTPTPGVVTGGQPTEEQLQQARDSGVKIVVNLRAKGEKGELPNEAEKVAELGMKYVHMPIESKAWNGLDEDNARKLAELVAEGPVLVHCTSGERAGALFALKAFYVDKQSTDEALEVGKAHGLTMEKVKKAATDAMAKPRR